MRSARQALLAASALALLGTGASVVSTPDLAPGLSEARSAGQNLPPVLPAPGQPVSPDDRRRRWLRSRYTSPRYRPLRKSTGTHKQNRRRQLEGKT